MCRSKDAQHARKEIEVHEAQVEEDEIAAHARLTARSGQHETATETNVIERGTVVRRHATPA